MSNKSSFDFGDLSKLGEIFENLGFGSLSCPQCGDRVMGGPVSEEKRPDMKGKRRKYLTFRCQTCSVLLGKFDNEKVYKVLTIE